MPNPFTSLCAKVTTLLGGRDDAAAQTPATTPAWPAPARKSESLILTSSVWRNAYGISPMLPAPANRPAGQSRADESLFATANEMPARPDRRRPRLAPDVAR